MKRWIPIHIVAILGGVAWIEVLQNHFGFSTLMEFWLSGLLGLAIGLSLINLQKER